MSVAGDVNEGDKVKIASEFLSNAPPGEFNEVFNAVRVLVNNDTLLKEGCASAIAHYNTAQFIPVKLDGHDRQTLVTPHNDLGNGRFSDDNSKKSFRYDHLRKEASDVQPYNGDHTIEGWRQALQKELDLYINEHYAKIGVGCVFARQGQAVVCIESHQFQPKNFCNGRWRSEWIVPPADGKTSSHELKGKILVQVHYFEEGNVQLLSEKPVSAKVQYTADLEKAAKEVLRVITEEEAKYQQAVQENYACMSDSTFKALRRQLPVIRAKMDWNKVQSYRIGQEMKQ